MCQSQGAWNEPVKAQLVKKFIFQLFQHLAFLFEESCGKNKAQDTLTKQLTWTLSMSAGFGKGRTEILSNVITFVDRIISVRYIGSLSTGFPCNRNFFNTEKKCLYLFFIYKVLQISMLNFYLPKVSTTS